MHEIALAETIAARTLEIAREHGATSVARVALSIGLLQQIVPEALETAFHAAVTGTAAEGARLEWTLEEAAVACPRCDFVYNPEPLFWVCPVCGAAGGRAIRGDGLLIEAVELETSAEFPGGS